MNSRVLERRAKTEVRRLDRATTLSIATTFNYFIIDDDGFVNRKLTEKEKFDITSNNESRSLSSRRNSLTLGVFSGISAGVAGASEHFLRTISQNEGYALTGIFILLSALSFIKAYEETKDYQIYARAGDILEKRLPAQRRK